VLLATDTAPALTAACQTQQPVLKAKSPCMDSIGTPVMRNVVLGGIGESSTIKSSDPCGGSVPTASALIVTFLLNNYDNAEFRAQAEAWEAEVFIQTAAKMTLLLQNDLQTPLSVSYMAGRSVQDSLSSEAKDNAWIVAVSYAAMFVYVAAALGTPLDRVKSRYKLAATGILIVLSSLCIAIGLLSAAGLKTTLIVWEVVPFLALAIGVDNMFIITRQYDRVCAQNSSSSSTSNNSTAYSDNDENSSNSNTAALLNANRDLYTRVSSSSDNSTYSNIARYIRKTVVSMCKEPTRDAIVEQYMGITVATVGPSILGAGVCEVLAFAVGMCTDVTLCTTDIVHHVSVHKMLFPSIERAVSNLDISVMLCASNVYDATLTDILISVHAYIFACFAAVDVAALHTGALTDIPALRQFCIVAAVTVLVNMLQQLTWYIAALSLDSRRVQQHRKEFQLCCGNSDSNNTNTDAAYTPINKTAHNIDDISDINDQPALSIQRDNTVSSAHSTTTTATVDNYTDSSKVSLLMERHYIPQLFSSTGKLLTLVIAVALTVFGCIGVSQLQLGLEPQLAAPVNFYLQDYYRDQFSLGEAGPPAYIVLRDVDYYAVFTNSTKLQQIKDLTTGLSQLSDSYVELPIYSWIDAMSSWIAQRDTLTAVTDCPVQIVISSSEDFSVMLQTFLSIPITSQCCQSHGICGAQFETDVHLHNSSSSSSSVNSSTNVVRASRMRFNLKPLRTQADFVNSFYYLQKVTADLAAGIDKAEQHTEQYQQDSSGIDSVAFPYSIYMIYYVS
jgi:Sterol-sensing domain of SREBP cleavage-activation/Patched family